MSEEQMGPFSAGEIADYFDQLISCRAHAEGKGYYRKRMWRRSDGSISSGAGWSANPSPAQIGPPFLYDHKSNWQFIKEAAEKVTTGEVSLSQWEMNFKDFIFELCHATASVEGGTEWDEKAVFERAVILAAPKLKQLDNMISRIQSGELKIGDRNFKAAMGQICKLQG